MTYDANGMERQPFDGRPLDPPTVRYRYRPTTNHGPTCRPSNPEIGCECGYAEWLDEQRELAELLEALDTAPCARDDDQRRAVEFYLAHDGAR